MTAQVLSVGAYGQDQGFCLCPISVSLAVATARSCNHEQSGCPQATARPAQPENVYRTGDGTTSLNWLRPIERFAIVFYSILLVLITIFSLSMGRERTKESLAMCCLRSVSVSSSRWRHRRREPARFLFGYRNRCSGRGGRLSSTRVPAAAKASPARLGTNTSFEEISDWLTRSSSVSVSSSSIPLSPTSTPRPCMRVLSSLRRVSQRTSTSQNWLMIPQLLRHSSLP